MIKGFILLFLKMEDGAGFCCLSLACVFTKLMQKPVYKVASLLCHLLASTGTSDSAPLLSSQRCKCLYVWSSPSVLVVPSQAPRSKEDRLLLKLKRNTNSKKPQTKPKGVRVSPCL